jgi:hypothetical protein
VTRRRRLVITVCPREPGVVRLPIRRGDPPTRLDAAAIVDRLRRLVAERNLQHMVEIHEACAGGCARPGPNVTVTLFPIPRPGAPADHVATARKTYVYSLSTLPSLADLLTDHLPTPLR